MKIHFNDIIYHDSPWYHAYTPTFVFKTDIVKRIDRWEQDFTMRRKFGFDIFHRMYERSINISRHSINLFCFNQELYEKTMKKMYKNYN